MTAPEKYGYVRHVSVRIRQPIFIQPLVLLSVLGLSASALASDSLPRWLLVTASESAKPHPDVIQASRVFERTATAIGFPMYSAEHASDWFANNFSRGRRELTEQERAALKPCADAALEQLVSGNAKRASRIVEDCLEPIEKALDVYNHRAEDATLVFDICLFKVRALEYDKHLDEAYHYAVKCRRLVPDAKPSTHLHPPEVVSLVMKADSDLHAEKHGRLHIRSKEPNCTVFLNGRRAGQTPLDTPPLPGGTYWISLDCSSSGPSRVHRIHLGAEAITLFIDSVFDSILITDGYVGLRYSSPSVLRARLPSDLKHLANPIHASEVFVISADKRPRVMRIDRFVPARNQVLASVWIKLAENGEEFVNDAASTAINELIRERSVDLSSHQPVEAKPWQPDPSGLEASYATEETNTTSEVGPVWLGVTLAAAGVVGLTTGWIVQQRYSDEPIDESQRGWHWLPGGLGTVALTASLPFWLPAQSGVPWWSWLIGGAGVAISSLGMYGALIKGGCTERESNGGCLHEEVNSGLGDIMLMSGIPLIGVPITYLIRDALGVHQEVTVNTQASAQGFTLGFSVRN